MSKLVCRYCGNFKCLHLIHYCFTLLKYILKCNYLIYNLICRYYPQSYMNVGLKSHNPFGLQSYLYLEGAL